MKDYRLIGDCFKKSFGDIKPSMEFQNAIKIMEKSPDLCNKLPCWDETIWLIIQDYLNSGGLLQEEDYFFHACALLEL